MAVMTVFDYIEQNKNITFKEKGFNEIDNIILSLISYLNFSYIEGINTIENMGKIYLERHKYKEIAKAGWAQKDAYLILEKLINSERYKNIKIQNYIYIATDEEQFSAVTFIISKKLKYVAFEGTDHLMVGWKEDFELSYKYPVPAQIHAIKYLKNATKLFGPKIIVGGHSKGGNLAQISSMELNIFKKLKIKKIYSNDGPGLRLKQFKSFKYKLIRKKLEHIVPENSVVGVMLRNDKYKVVKTNKITIMSHIPSTWLIEDDNLIETQLSNTSIKLENKIINWLDNNDDTKRKILIETIFNVLEKSGITNTMNLKDIRCIINVIKEIKNVDKETKDLAVDLITSILF